MTRLRKYCCVAATGVSLFALSVVSAPAAVVCNDDDNICWHSYQVYEFPPPDARVTVHRDDWQPSNHYAWREHEGRGYWRGGEWRDW
jgi:hypothetical protein